jgi:hypothetical protein
MSTERIASARLALNQALLAGEDTTSARAALRKLQTAEAAKPNLDNADQEPAQRAAQVARDAQIQSDAGRLLEARNARIAACVKSFEVKRI